MSESEQDDRMGARLDETRKAIEASQQQLDNSQGILQANPQLVFTQVLPSLYAVLHRILDPRNRGGLSSSRDWWTC